MPLPEPLIRAITSKPFVGVSIIAGAGCSVEDPTNLPLSRDLSIAAFERLVLDGLLQEDECSNPEDLSQLADVVYKKFGSQAHLVNRFPLNELRYARANDGYLVMVALMREGVVQTFATLNFDLSVRDALTRIGAINDVVIIKGPEDHALHGARNVIFLHRSVDAKPDELILRTEQLEEAWKGGWEELIAVRVISAPVTIFVGLGSRAEVLVQTVSKVRAAVPAGTQLYQVDPGERSKSEYVEALDLKEEEYLRLDWVSFMEELSKRVAAEQGLTLIRGCKELVEENELTDAEIKEIVDRLTTRGLLSLGKHRAEWFLADAEYHAYVGAEEPFISDVFILLKSIEKKYGLQVVFTDTAVVEFREGNGTKDSFAFVIAPGKRLTAIESKLKKRKQRWTRRNPAPSKIVLCGLARPLEERPAMPESIVSSRNDDSIIAPADELVGLADVRQRLEQIFNTEGAVHD